METHSGERYALERQYTTRDVNVEIFINCLENDVMRAGSWRPIPAQLTRVTRSGFTLLYV